MWTLVVPFPCPWPRFGGAFSCWPAAVAGLVIRGRPHFLATSAPLTVWRRQRPLHQAAATCLLPAGPPTRGHGWVARHGMERKAPSLVIQMTNGTGSIRQFASKAARCKARAAFELCGSPAVVGTAGWRSNPAE
jgi:hypothetical protein